MRLVHYLQHWLSGTGTRLQVADFVPESHPIRQWADAFPWAALVSAIEHSFATRFPTRSPRGRRPVSVRVLLALELLNMNWAPRMRTSATASAPTLPSCTPVVSGTSRSIPPKPIFVLPETLCEFRGRFDEALWMS